MARYVCLSRKKNAETNMANQNKIEKRVVEVLRTEDFIL